MKAGGRAKEEQQMLALIVRNMERSAHYKEITVKLKTQKNSSFVAHKEEYYDVWRRALKPLVDGKKSKEDVAFAVVNQDNDGHLPRMRDKREPRRFGKSS